MVCQPLVELAFVPISFPQLACVGWGDRRALGTYVLADSVMQQTLLAPEPTPLLSEKEKSNELAAVSVCNQGQHCGG